MGTGPCLASIRVSSGGQPLDWNPSPSVFTRPLQLKVQICSTRSLLAILRIKTSRQRGPCLEKKSHHLRIPRGVRFTIAQLPNPDRSSPDNPSSDDPGRHYTRARHQPLRAEPDTGSRNRPDSGGGHRQGPSTRNSGPSVRLGLATSNLSPEYGACGRSLALESQRNLERSRRQGLLYRLGDSG